MTVQQLSNMTVRLITLAVLVTSCAPSAAVPPEGTIATLTTPPPVSSITLSPTPSITPFPTNTSIPTISPISTLTPVPWGRAPISPENAVQVTQLTMWGRGTILKALPASQEKNLVVLTPLGVYLYRLDDFALLLFIEDVTDFWVSPNGEILATGHPDASIKLWRTSDGSLEQTLTYNIGELIHPYTSAYYFYTPEQIKALPPGLIEMMSSKPVNTLIFSVDNRTIAVGYGDAHIGIWEIGLDTPVSVFRSDLLTDPAEEMAYSSNGQYLAVDNGQALILWQLTNENPLFRIRTTQAEYPAFSPDGKILAFISRTPIRTYVYLLEVPGGGQIRKIEPKIDAASLSFSEDGQTLLISGKNYETGEPVRQTRNIADNKIIEEVPVVAETLPLEALRLQGHVMSLTGVEMPTDQEIQARITGNFLWLLPLGEMMWAPVDKQALSEQGSFFWMLPRNQFTHLKESGVTCTDGLLEVVYPDGTQSSVPVPLHPNCEGAVLIPDRDQALVWTANRLSMVSLISGEFANLLGHDETIHTIAFGNNSTLMASGTIAREAMTSEIIIWQLDPLKELVHTDKLDAGDMRILLFSPDGSLLASAGEMLRLWEVPGGQMRKYINTYVSALAFSPDGKILAFGDLHGNVHLLQVSNGTEVAMLEGHTDTVEGLAFISDGTSLVSASYDGTVRVWGIK